MKKFLFVALFTAVFGRVYLNGQTWHWALEEAAVGEGLGVCHDNQGNLYTANYINGPATIGGFAFPTSPSALIVKYDPNGNVLWAANCFNGTGESVACDASGNVFFTGNFTGTATAGSQTLVSAGSNDIFLIKYSPTGSLLWALSFGGPGADTGYGVTVDTQGNPVVCGYMSPGTFSVGASVLTSTTGTRYILIKCNGAGVPQWGLQNGISGANVANSICSDANDNIYLTGYFSNTITVGTGTFVSTGSQDFFLAKYSPAGTPVWFKTGGGTGQDIGWCARMEPSGDIYVSGGFNATFSLGLSTFASAGLTDWFYARYSPPGVLLATNHGGGTGNEIAYSIAPYSGGVYIAGCLDFAGMPFGFSSLTPNNSNDGMFLCHFDAAGNPVYGTAMNGGGDDVMALTIYNECNLYLAGDVSTLSLLLGTITLTHSAGEVLFVAKFNTGVYSPTLIIPSSYTVCQGSSLTLSVSGANTYTWTGGPNTNTYVVSPVTTTNYVIAGSNASCSTKMSVYVVVVANNITASVSTPTPFCPNSTATLTVIGASTYSWSTGATTSTVAVSPAVSTTYSVSALSSSGCAYTGTLSVNVLPAPSVSASVIQTMICIGKSSALSATGANTYTWSTNSHAANITVSPTIATTYSVTGTDTVTGCTGTSAVQVVVQNCQGIGTNEEPKGYVIFPIPSRGELNIRFDSSIMSGQLIIQNVSGATILEREIGNGSVMRLNELSPGLYLVTFIHSGIYSVGKISVER
jgi:hypothetical protein